MSRASEIAAELLESRPALKASLTGSRAEQVYAFHTLYDCPIHKGRVTRQIEHMSDDRIALRLGLIVEELKELLEDGFGIKTEMRFYNNKNLIGWSDTSKMMQLSTKRDIVGASDALADLSYVIDGFALEMGVNLDEVINEVHASNMTKPDENGQPIYRADGKVLKGPSYVEPNIEDCIFKKDN